MGLTLPQQGHEVLEAPTRQREGSLEEAAAGNGVGKRVGSERVDRRAALGRIFKAVCVTVPTVGVVGFMLATNRGRSAVGHARDYMLNRVDEAQLEGGKRRMTLAEQVAARERILQREMDQRAQKTYQYVVQVYKEAPEEKRRFLRRAGLAPEGNEAERIVISRGINLSWVGVLPGRLFIEGESADTLPFELRPEQRAVWMRPDNPLSRQNLLSIPLLPDDPEVFRAARDAGFPLEEYLIPNAVHTTNSWGLRGPEPNPHAPLRVIVLGDSFKHGYGVGDKDTSSVRLEHHLGEQSGGEVSVLNTGLSGIGPKEYALFFQKYVDTFHPQVVVISVCCNDFGDGNDVYEGKGEDWPRAIYYLRQIWDVCQEKGIQCLITPVYSEEPLARPRSSFSDRLARELQVLGDFDGYHFVDTFPDLKQEDMRLRREELGRTGQTRRSSYVHLAEYGDSHFNPAGTDVWGQELAEHIMLLRGGGAPRER